MHAVHAAMNGHGRHPRLRLSAGDLDGPTTPSPPRPGGPARLSFVACDAAEAGASGGGFLPPPRTAAERRRLKRRRPSPPPPKKPSNLRELQKNSRPLLAADLHGALTFSSSDYDGDDERPVVVQEPDAGRYDDGRVKNRGPAAYFQDAADYAGGGGDADEERAWQEEQLRSGLGRFRGGGAASGRSPPPPASGEHSALSIARRAEAARAALPGIVERRRAAHQRRVAALAETDRRLSMAYARISELESSIEERRRYISLMRRLAAAAARREGDESANTAVQKGDGAEQTKSAK